MNVSQIHFEQDLGSGGRFRTSFDFSRAWWTPPLSAYDAWAVESTHIVERLGMAPLISLSDHDNIDGPVLLQHRTECRPAPVSVEWTVPFGGTFFHIGVHNLPPERARSIMTDLAAFTAQTSKVPLAEIFRALAAQR